MKAYDFEYDGICLSDLGFMICEFDSSDLETVSNGSEITFNTESTQYGMKYELVSSQYDSCLEATFQICRNTCDSDADLEITFEELHYMMRWLNRKEFHKFKLLEDDYVDLYFEGSFNVSKIEHLGVTVGLELTIITNRPFAIREPRTYTLNFPESGSSVKFHDPSDEEGYIYPETTITVNGSGELDIYNELENRNVAILNCREGEVITMNYPIISSSDSSHAIQNDFNWNFFRIANTFRNNQNIFTASIPCTISMEYSPVVKVGIG